MLSINFFFLLIYSFYSGIIVSFLINTNDTLFLNSIEDIMNAKFKIEAHKSAIFNKFEVMLLWKVYLLLKYDHELY